MVPMSHSPPPPLELSDSLMALGCTMPVNAILCEIAVAGVVAVVVAGGICSMANDAKQRML